MSTQDMTEAEVKLVDEKLRAEVAKLIAEVSKLNAETQHVDERLSAEVTKLIAETRHINITTLLAPALAAAGLMGATAAIVKLFF